MLMVLSTWAECVCMFALLWYVSGMNFKTVIITAIMYSTLYVCVSITVLKVLYIYFIYFAK